MPSKLFGVKYPAKGDKRKIRGKLCIAVYTGGKTPAENYAAHHYPITSVITSKKVGDVKFYTVWARYD
jgi:hypothetical protein